MRNIIAPYVAIILPTTLVLLLTVPQETQCANPVAIAIAAAKVAMAVLGPLVKGYLDDMRAKREAESVNIAVWMHNGDVKMNGCGFYFKVTGYSGGTGSQYFPDRVIHTCTNYEYEMRMTSQSAMYDTKVHLGNEQAKDIELHADGWHDTYVNVMCIGLSVRTIAGGPRAFCLNNDILKACKKLKNKWNNIDLRTNDIKLTRTSRGTHKIIFHNIEKLINSFERFNQNRNDVNAMSGICKRIDLVKGTASDNNSNCPAKKTWHEVISFEAAIARMRRYEDENKNPYGCNRYTNKKR